jgi:hypothetical protein
MVNHQYIKRISLEEIISKILLVVIAVLPIYYFHIIKDVPIKAFIFGAGSWGIGSIFKIFAHQLVVKKLSDKKVNNLIISFTNGFISGLGELAGAFLIILLVISLKKFTFTFDSILAFGIGIGSLETLLVVYKNASALLKGTSLEKSVIKFEEAFKKIEMNNRYITIYIPILERILATFLHISTRGLVFITILSQNIFPTIIALTVFIIADGFLGYNYLINNKLLTPKGLNTFYFYLFILTFFSVTIFFVLIQQYEVIAL